MAMGKLARARAATARAKDAARDTVLLTAAVSGALAAGGDAMALEYLPTGYDKESAGKGKGIGTNKRVQLLAAATAGLYLFGGDSMWARAGLVASASLLGAAVKNHKRQYQGDDVSTAEVYK